MNSIQSGEGWPSLWLNSGGAASDWTSAAALLMRGLQDVRGKNSLGLQRADGPGRVPAKKHADRKVGNPGESPGLPGPVPAGNFRPDMAIALLGVPWDASSSWRRGAARAPAAIRAEWEQARDYSNLFTESGANLGAKGVFRDAGDVAVSDPAPTRDAITAAVAGVIEAGDRPLVLGGDHSITWPVLRALHQAHGPIDVLHLDAHPDLYPEFGGDRYSHACPFARGLEDGFIARLVQIGLRSNSPPQREVAARFEVEQHPMTDWGRPHGLFFDRPLYISCDLDALDPAFAPGVSHPEPGGLSVRELITVLQRTHGRVVGADLVEYNPEADLDGRTAWAAVKLVKELAALLETAR